MRTRDYQECLNNSKELFIDFFIPLFGNSKDDLLYTGTLFQKVSDGTDGNFGSQFIWEMEFTGRNAAESNAF